MQTKTVLIPLSKNMFLCDVCGKPSIGKKFPVLDENFNTQKGLCMCEKCYKIKLNAD